MQRNISKLVLKNNPPFLSTTDQVEPPPRKL